MICQTPGCQADNGPAARFCGRCGTPLVPDTRVRGRAAHDGSASLSVAPAAGSPALPAILSVVIPGLGQLYNDDHKKGAVMFLVALVLVLPTATLAWWAMIAWSAHDAYQVAAGRGRRWS